MATQFGNFKVSFIWVETIPAIAAQQLGDKAQWGFLGMPGQFAKKFGELKAGGSSPELGLPWQKPRGHHFWKYYFAGRHAGDIAGSDAWKSRVPLRNKTAVKIVMEPPKPEDPQGAKVTFEIFYTPQGLGLVANAYYKGEDRLAEDLVQLAHAVRYRYRFRMDAGHGGGGMSLESAADHALATARRPAFGDAECLFRPQSTPHHRNVRARTNRHAGRCRRLSRPPRSRGPDRLERGTGPKCRLIMRRWRRRGSPFKAEQQ